MKANRLARLGGAVVATAGILFGLVAWPLAATAATLNPAYMQGFCGVDQSPGSPDTFTCMANGFATDPPLSIFAEASLVSQSAVVNAAGTLVFGAFFSDYSRLVYEVEVVYSGNPALINYNVPILVTTSGAAAASGVDSAGAGVTISGMGFGAGACSQVYGCFYGTSFGGTQTVYASPGVYQVVVSASATIYPGLGTASAFADPYLQIEPSFLQANPQYSLAFSDNIVNAPPVPEAPSLVLMLAGAAVIGLVSRRRLRR